MFCLYLCGAGWQCSVYIYVGRGGNVEHWTLNWNPGLNPHAAISKLGQFRSHSNCSVAVCFP